MSAPEYEEIDYACCECGCMAEHLWGDPPPTYPLCIQCELAEINGNKEIEFLIECHTAEGGVFFYPFKQTWKVSF